MPILPSTPPLPQPFCLNQSLTPTPLHPTPPYPLTLYLSYPTPKYLPSHPIPGSGKTYLDLDLDLDLDPADTGPPGPLLDLDPADTGPPGPLLDLDPADTGPPGPLLDLDLDLDLVLDKAGLGIGPQSTIGYYRSWVEVTQVKLK